MKVWRGIVSFVAAVAAGGFAVGVGNPAGAQEAGARPGPGEEVAVAPPDEIAATKILVEGSVGELKKHEGRPVPRDQHPKHHGAVRATFAVEAEIPEAVRVGLFARPRNYDAVLRFSNGRSTVDNTPDAHGLAVKVLGVEGKPLLDGEADAGTQDFILIDHPVFFATDPMNLVKFTAVRKAVESGDRSGAADFKQQFEILKAFAKLGTPSPLEMVYFSQVPSKLGSYAVKYRVVPDAANASGRPPLTKDSPGDALREAMVEHLTTKRRPAKFAFQVQLQTDADAMPVEDPTVEWTSEPITVATITVEPQEFASPEQLEFAENLSNTPWHGIEEHRPLGGINRARKQVYQATSIFRHEANGVPRKEPTVADLDRLYPR